MKRTLFTALLGAGLIAGAAAMAAEEWGIDGEKKARFKAKVVDIACELTGDCPANCGAGKRQLGLLTGEGKLILVAKNQDIFAGGVEDLLPFCGKEITADGLMITTPHMPLFALQFKKPEPDGKWSRANWWGKNWSKANGGKKSGQWFKSDARVLKELKARGVFGIPGLKPPKE
ncbi:MAG: hypothetical protein OXR84_14875 [Magnetovibrio sp.]|nr:hypothetical protein [Magnetovibrio sp.]